MNKPSVNERATAFANQIERNVGLTIKQYDFVIQRSYSLILKEQENQRNSLALQRELVEALKEATTTARAGYRAGKQSVERWDDLVTRAEKELA